MKAMIVQLLFSLLLLNCSSINREKPVDITDLAGRDYRLFQNTPAWELAKAVQDENEKKINEIVSESPKLMNYQDPKFGNTLLMLTIMNQQIKPFKKLIEKQADINIHNTFDGASPIIEAVRLRYYDIKYAEILIQNGANVNDIETGERKKGNSTRETPLISAVSSGKIEFVELLIKHGVEINYRNEFDQSALSKSVQLSKYKIAYYLLQKGADYNCPIFYRPDYSIPVDKQDLNEKGKPMYLVDVLREAFFDFDTDEYKYKMQIVDFLKTKGIDYRATPIPDYIKRKAQAEYPKSWHIYLEKY